MKRERKKKGSNQSHTFSPIKLERKKKAIMKRNKGKGK
jgi:hypothetical protein